MTEVEIEAQAVIYANEKISELKKGENSYNLLQRWSDSADGFAYGAKWGLAESSKEIIIKIKELLCQKDEDYDKAIISPKFLNDYLDQIRMD